MVDTRHCRRISIFSSVMLFPYSVLLLRLLCCFVASASQEEEQMPLDLTVSSHLLSSPSFFVSSHSLMLSSFKIFIYPPFPSHHHSDLRSLPLPPQNAEELFFHSLSRSSFVSENPLEAHLFFVPVSLGAMRRNTSHSLGRNLGRNLMLLVQQVRERYPFWDRTLGADHFVACCQRFKADGSRNVLELQKNAIWLACSELFGGEESGARTGDGVVDSQFFPHKDIAMPPFRPQATHSKAIVQDRDRPILVYVVDPAPSSAFERWKRDSDFVIASLNDDSAPYLDMLSTSKFCLTFASLGHNTTIVEGMRLGCVPVIVSDGYLQGLPFQDILDWQRFSVIASVSQLHKLKKYLKSISEARYRELQLAAMAASRHLEWHTPPKLYDAFHMLMYQLWLRRHTIRYSRRSTEKRSAA